MERHPIGEGGGDGGGEGGGNGGGEGEGEGGREEIDQEIEKNSNRAHCVNRIIIIWGKRLLLKALYIPTQLVAVLVQYRHIHGEN